MKVKTTMEAPAVVGVKLHFALFIRKRDKLVPVR